MSTRFNAKKGFVRLLLIVSYAIGIVAALHYNFNVYTDNPLVATFWCIGILPVTIFLTVYVVAMILVLLFKWIKSGFTNILAIGLIFPTSWAMAAELTAEENEYLKNNIMPYLYTPHMFEEFLERVRNSPHSDPIKAMDTALRNSLADRWHRGWHKAFLGTNISYTFLAAIACCTGILIVGYIITHPKLGGNV